MTAPVYASPWTGPRLRWIAAAIVVLNGFFPAVWILLTSLKTEAELVTRPITWLPRNPTLQNYVAAFTDQPLLKFLANSAAVTAISTPPLMVMLPSASRVNVRSPTFERSSVGSPFCIHVRLPFSEPVEPPVVSSIVMPISST